MLQFFLEINVTILNNYMFRSYQTFKGLWTITKGFSHTLGDNVDDYNWIIDGIRCL
jgi:IS1 family transposase